MIQKLAVILQALSLSFISAGTLLAGDGSAAKAGANVHVWQAHEVPAHIEAARQYTGALTYHRTPHFVLAHQNAPQWAVGAGELLESTHDIFYEAFTAAGFKLESIREPLACIRFTDRRAFHAYARGVDRSDMSWSQGYYSARTNLVALADSREEHEHGGVTVHRASAHSGSARRTTHEIAHQLAFNSGLQRRGVMYPLWVAEGLATAFEVEIGGAMGPGQDNPVRRRRLVEAYDAHRLLPLHALLVTTRMASVRPSRQGEFYAQSWGLFTFLFTQHPEQLQKYLAHLASLPMGSRSMTTLRREFTTAFGDINVLDREFETYIRSLRDVREAPALAVAAGSTP